MILLIIIKKKKQYCEQAYQKQGLASEQRLEALGYSVSLLVFFFKDPRTQLLTVHASPADPGPRLSAHLCVLLLSMLKIWRIHPIVFINSLNKCCQSRIPSSSGQNFVNLLRYTILSICMKIHCLHTDASVTLLFFSENYPYP